MSDIPATDLETATHLPANGEPAKRLVVLLHGYGADMHDLIGLASHWTEMIPDAEFISPNAPEACDELPGGRQWFPIGDLDLERMHEGALTVAPTLDAFLDSELEKRGLTERNLVLIGFSQGAMLALHVGLRRVQAPAGIIGYSGMLVGPEHLADEILARPPVLLIHGSEDPLIPVQAQTMTENALTGVDVRVKSHVSKGLGHGIDPAGLALGGHFLVAAFGAADEA